MEAPGDGTLTLHNLTLQKEDLLLEGPVAVSTTGGMS